MKVNINHFSYSYAYGSYAYGSYGSEGGIAQLIEGEETLFSCDIWESYPDAIATWYINDVEMNEYVISHETVIYDVGYPPNHYTNDTVSEFALTPSLLEHQDAVLRCKGSNTADPVGLSAELQLDIIGKLHSST